MKLKHFILAAAIIVIGLGLFKTYRVLTAKDWTMQSDCRETEPVSWSAVVAGNEEPGDRLVVTGKLLESDGQTPVAGASIHLYHVDSSGAYGQSKAGQLALIEICGIIRTDTGGNYRFETIVPGSYRDRSEPAHIHYEIWSPEIEFWETKLKFSGIPAYYIDDTGVLTEDPDDGNSWDIVRPLVRDSAGMLHIYRDIKLRPWWKSLISKLLKRD